MQKSPSRNNPRRSLSAGRLAATLRARLSYANLIASLALFIALGGTAAAAVTLGRDSVGSPQIRQDAVRSPEIRTDAVRSPEIVSGGVRSSEIRDEGIKFSDVSPAARAALRGEVRIAEDDNPQEDSAPECSGTDLSVCPDYLALNLASASAASPAGRPAAQPSPGPQASGPARNWLVQAKLDIAFTNGGSINPNRCGLVNTAVAGPRAVLDEASAFEAEAIALTAVVKKGAGNPTIALRCTSQPTAAPVPMFAKITALEVGTVTGP